MRCLFIFLLMILVSACKKDSTDPPAMNLSDEYSSCNSTLDVCSTGNGEYCLFGYKWGINNTFSQNGLNASGPRESGGLVSYSFHESNGLVNTHRQVDLPGQSFNTLIACAQDEIRRAIEDWAAVADIEFEELPDNSDSDIRFLVADIVQTGTGYPNFDDSLCGQLAGHVVMQANAGFGSCDVFYQFALHEIGHTLGLGHVNAISIMNPDFIDLNLDGLQAGDLSGLRAIYGDP